MRSYRKTVLSFLVFITGLLGVTGIQAIEYAEPDSETKLITVGDPEDPMYANAGDNLRNGVGSIFIEFNGIPQGGYICTASAISEKHILTAAHCVVEQGDSVKRLRFILNAGLDEPLILEAAGFAVHPWYSLFAPFYGAFAHGDIAIVELVEPLPEYVEIYDIYRDDDEFDKEARHYGYGRSGKGNKGATQDADFFYARTGLNMYEQTLQPLLGDRIEDQLLLDFDSGGSKHNAMAWWFSTASKCGPDNDTPPWAQDGQCTTFKDGNYPDFKGFGKFEVGVAPGDSGGPSFIDDKIAGVHSFGFTHFCEGVTNGTEFTCGLDSSFGEMSGDTRVSFYQGYIDGVVEENVEMTPIPEPALSESGVGGTSEDVSGFLSNKGKSLINDVYAATKRARTGGILD